MTKRNITLTRLGPLLWRVGVGVLLLCAVLLVAALWYAGKDETLEAFSSGRRILIRLDDGTIQGKVTSTVAPAVETQVAETPKTEPPPAAAETPAATETPPPAPSEEAVTQAPAVEPPKTAEAPKAPPVEETGTVVAGEASMIIPETAPLLEARKEANSLGDTYVNAPLAEALKGINAALVEKTKKGDLPIIGADGTKPWRYYAKPFERQGKQPMIAVIITGLGSNKLVTDTAIKLNENITLAFSPYAKDALSWGTAARATGHEAMLDLPLEPNDYPATDPGPYGLLTQKGAETNETNLQWVMAQLPIYVGLLTPQNEAFTGNSEAFKLLLQSLANRGLLLVVGREPAKGETKEILASTNTAVVVADALIDEELSAAAIQTRLTALERLAQKRGHAVGIAQSFPITVEQLKLWSETLAAKGIVLVPVSAIARLRFS